MPTLAAEVRKEPLAALDGGADGLDVIRRLVADAPPLLAADGALVLEVGAGQAPAVVALFAADGRYQPATITKDLGGIERVVAARLSQKQVEPSQGDREFRSPDHNALVWLNAFRLAAES